jgi:sRNA-binding regulator protein Hfq
MKKIFLISAILLLTTIGLSAQQYIDVVYLKNGSVIRGVIMEQVPNQSIKIQTADKSIFVYKMDEVDKMVKEEAKTSSPSISSSMSSQGRESYSITIEAGLLLTGPGKINVGGYEMEPEISPLVKMDVDGILVPKLSMGVSAIFGLMNVDGYDESSNYMSIGGTIKPIFNAGTDMQIKPGLFVGYNYIMNDNMLNNSDGLNVGFILQFAKGLPSGKGFVGEFGFISQPVGGDGYVDISFPPVFYIMVGFEFGR